MAKEEIKVKRRKESSAEDKEHAVSKRSKRQTLKTEKLQDPATPAKTLKSSTEIVPSITPKAPPSAEEKREKRKEQKRICEERKAKKPLYELICKIKPLGQTIGQKSLAMGEKKEALEEAMKIIQGNIGELAVKHEASRIIQSIIKHGDEQQRLTIAQELKDHLMEVGNTAYGAHVLRKLIVRCAKSREILTAAVRGNLLKLIRMNKASSIVEELYQHSSIAQRSKMVSELYGPEFRLFQTTGDCSLTAILQKTPAKKENILKNLQQALTGVMRKQSMKYAIVHRVINDYLSIESPKKLRADVGTYIEHVEALSCSAEGCCAIVRIIAAASAKERKALVKTFKPHIEMLIGDAAQIQILMGLLDYVDDTVLVGKAIIAELAKRLDTLLESKIGRRIIFFMLGGRLGQHITPEVVQLLDKCDMLAAESSKKDNKTRRGELLEYLLPALRTHLEQHCGQMLLDTHLSFILVEFMGYIEVEEASLFLDKLISSLNHANLVDFVREEKGNIFIRNLIKKSPSLAHIIYDRLKGDLAGTLAEKAGFLLLVMLRYKELAEEIQRKKSEIERVNSEAASMLLSKLGATPKCQ